MKGTKWLRCNR